MLENTKIYQYLKRMEKKAQDCLDVTKKMEEECKQIQQIDLLQNEKIEQILLEQKRQQEQIELLVRRTSQFDFINTELLLMQSTSKKKVLLLGFYGANNTGDELMLQALLEKLGQEQTIDVTIMIADNLEYELNTFGNVHFLHYPKTPSDTSIIMNYFDAILVGGGALIDDTNYQEGRMDNVCNLLIDLCQNAIHKNKEIYLVGLSTSDALRDEDYIQKLQNIIKKSRYVSLRDTYSIETLKNAGIETNSVQLVEDLVFSLPSFEDTKSEDNNQTYRLGMVLVNYIDDKTFLSILKTAENFLNDIESEKEKVIHLIPFYDYCHFDVTQYQKRIENYKGKIKVIIEPYTSNYTEVCKQLTQCDMMICMRYHASLLALKMGIPSVHLVYDVHRHYLNKMKYLLESYEMRKYSVSLKGFEQEQLLYVLQKANKNQKEIVEKAKESTKKIEEKAKKQKENLFSSILAK